MDAPPVLRPPSWSLLPQYFGLAELAALVARYDRGAAEVVFAPVAAQFDQVVADQNRRLGADGFGALAAAGAFDARAAKALVDAFLGDPPLPRPGESVALRRNDKLQAGITVARILGLPPILRFREPFQTQQSMSDWIGAIED